MKGPEPKLPGIPSFNWISVHLRYQSHGVPLPIQMLFIYVDPVLMIYHMKLRVIETSFQNVNWVLITVLILHTYH